MPNAARDAAPSAEFAFELATNRIAPAFYALLTKRNKHYLFSGLSVRKTGANYLVVVRAIECDTLACVVCFGNADTFALALRNASLAIGKGQWRKDKFAGKLVG